jgi:protein gp37
VTKIQWTEQTWNPTTGCDRISPGCDNCYALTMAKRLKGMGAAKYQTDGNPKTSGPGFGIAAHAQAILEPLRWKKPRLVFVNSMSDLFHSGIQTADLHLIFGVMAATPQHTYQVLTKRHGRMRSLLNDPQFAHMAFHRAKMYGRPDTAPRTWPLPNVHLGVSVENQKWADIRIPALLDTPAAVRFLSMEPLIGPVDLCGPIVPGRGRPRLTYWLDGRPGYGDPVPTGTGIEMRPLTTGPSLDWVIVGGESGPGARPMNPEWAAQIVQECQHSNVPVFVKQLGSIWARDTTVNGKTVAAHGDTKGGDPDYWPAHLRVREYPEAATHG